MISGKHGKHGNMSVRFAQTIQPAAGHARYLK